MKWLFFALLALNIAIFGGMTLPRVMEKQEAEMERGQCPDDA